MKEARGVCRLQDVVCRPVDRALMETCLVDKDGYDACYFRRSSSSPTIAALRDDGDLRCTVRSVRDLDIAQLSSVQIKIKTSSTRYICFSLSVTQYLLHTFQKKKP